MSKTMKAQEIAELISGTVIGDPNKEVCGVNSLKLAAENEASFLANIKYRIQLDNSNAGVVLINGEWKITPKENQTLIVCGNPDKAFTKLCLQFAPEPQHFEPGIHPSAVVAEDAVIGEGSYIGPNAVLEKGVVIGKNTVIGAGTYLGEHVQVGDNCMIYPNVSVMRFCKLGNKLIIHSGVVIGADGFGFTATFTGLVKVPQNGFVQIDDNVEIGANTTIDRARFGKTWIKKGVKIDNLVQVGHNVIVGESSVLISQCGIAGSAELGRGVVIYARAGVNGHTTVGDGAMLAATSISERNMPPGAALYGTPAETLENFTERHMLPRTVRKLTSRVEKLEAMLAELQSKKQEN